MSSHLHDIEIFRRGGGGFLGFAVSLLLLFLFLGEGGRGAGAEIDEVDLLFLVF